MYECCYEHAPECQYSAENHGMVATQIHCAHMGIVWGANTVLRDLDQVIHEKNHSKTNHPGITRDDHYEPPLDLADVNLKEVNVINI